MKKILIFVFPVVAIGGFVGLALAGIIKVPGLTPKKHSPGSLYGEQAAAQYGEPKDKGLDKPKVETKPPTSKVAGAKPPIAVSTNDETSDPALGAKKLAQLWNGLPTERLVELCKSFTDKDLAPVLIKMDPEKVSDLLTALDASRSAKLSKELQKQASIVTKTAS